VELGLLGQSPVNHDLFTGEPLTSSSGDTHISVVRTSPSPVYVIDLVRVPVAFRDIAEIASF